VSTGRLTFPSPDYYLDESDPDITVLRRRDDSFVAAFSAMGATREGIMEVVREDYRERVLDRPAWLDLAVVASR
jgi:hypothetical protein